ncbi:MAG: YkgJ family cysteine cluster protein [Deltaproteobacteria bacterium]
MKKIFSCRCCGHCCHGASTVSLTQREIERIAAYLSLTVETMRSRYLVQKGTRTEMKVVDGHCIFFGEDGLCAIHPVKPFPCRQWPLHPSILDDRQAWEAIRTDCPGFERNATYEDACKLVRNTRHGS